MSLLTQKPGWAPGTRHYTGRRAPTVLGEQGPALASTTWTEVLLLLVTGEIRRRSSAKRRP